MKLNRLVVASILGLAFVASTSAYACDHGSGGDDQGGGWSFLGWCHHGNHDHHGDCDHDHDGGGSGGHHDCNPTKGYNGTPCSTDGGSGSSGSGSGSGSGTGPAGSGKGISG